MHSKKSNVGKPTQGKEQSNNTSIIMIGLRSLKLAIESVANFDQTARHGL